MMLLGLPLECAQREAEAQGFNIQVEHLANLWEDSGVWRVIRQTQQDRSINLTVTLFAQLADEGDSTD